MALGIRRRGIQTVKKRIDLPAELVFRFEKLPGNYDASRQEVIFGKWSQVLTELLRQYIISEEIALKEKATFELNKRERAA